jgi:general secretion pathway protein C
VSPGGAADRLNHNRRMPARLSAFIVWALVAASAVFWGLRLFVQAPAAPAHTLAVGTDGATARVDLTRLLGAPPVEATATPQQPAMASRFQLLGVMAPRKPGEQGLALISVDGKMPRAFRVGSAIDSDLVLQQVSLRTASIGPARGAAAVVLELPPLPPPATGSLPPAAFVPPVSGTVPQIAVPPTPVAPVIAPPPAMPQVAPEGQPVPPRHSRGMGLTPRGMQQQSPEQQQPQQPAPGQPLPTQ